MKRTSFFAVVFLGFIVLMIFASCESLDTGSGLQVDDPSKNLPPVLEDDEESSGDQLDHPIFAQLPSEVKSYLQAVSAAFKNHDEAFLLAQGEAMFEQTVRPHYFDDEYFIMLYRIGDSDEFLSAVSKNIAISDISRIEYTGWENGDPVMEIRGRVFYDNNHFLPCRIMLAWRLDEPKIIGLYP
jgi:hypothetical protein